MRKARWKAGTTRRRRRIGLRRRTSRRTIGIDARSFAIDILPTLKNGDSLYRTVMPDRISLRRLIQQNAYLSDSTAGRQITGDFCARFQVPNGGRVRNFIHTGCDSSTENAYAVGALDHVLNPEASRALGDVQLGFL